MTISSTTNRASFTGNGVTTSFSFPYFVIAAADLKVYLNGTLQTITTDYTLSGSAPYTSGTNVQFVSAPAADDEIVVIRDPAITQAVDLVDNDPFDPDTSVEQPLDKLTMIAQRLADRLDRAIVLPDDETSGADMTLPSLADRANMALYFNSEGEPIAADVSAATVTFSPDVQTYSGNGVTVAFTLPEAPGSAAALIVAISGVLQKPATDYNVSGTTLTFTSAPASGTNNVCVVNFGIARAVDTVDADGVTYTPNGSGAANSDLQTKMREILSVKDFGATGDGVTDDTTAISNAITAAAAISVSASSGSSSRPIVHFPAGIYRVASQITASAYLSLVGQRAVIKPDAGFTAFSTTGYQAHFTGLVFIGGAAAVSIATSNVDTCTVHFDSCEFQDQTTQAIGSDTNSASTLVTVKRSKFYNATGGVIGINAQCLDKVVIEDCWATWAGTFLVNGTASKYTAANLRNLFAVPTGGSTIWVKNYGYVSAHQCRFGGETGAKPVQHYGDIDTSMGNITGVDFTDCEVQAAGNYAVEFYALPNIFVWDRIRGVANNGFYFDAAIGNLTRASTYNAFASIARYGRDEGRFEGTTEPAARMATISQETLVGADSLTVADKVLQINNNGSAQYGYSGAASGVSTPAFTHTFGATVRGWSGSSSSYNGSASERFSTALNGLTTGWYTAVYDIEITGSMPVGVLLDCADVRVVKMLSPGKHLVCIPAYYNSATSAQYVGYALTRLNNAKTIGLGPIRVFSGKVQPRGQNNVLYSTAAPTTLRWELGDRVINSVPTVGQPKAWTCTAAGTPGTWTSEGNL